ncbi:hypothetical protein [Sulfuricurvum sp.]|uniref:hypothetical protein n=1 Tax=Sulfuricurvum sp. TaxID=2025608 RepID=UPI003566DEF7
MKDALKELFNAYKHLPVGVMFFKEEKLFFVNDHLRTTLLLANLPSDEIITIIGSMVGLEDPSHVNLNNFLSHNDFLLYRDRVIQIEHQSVDNITVYVLTRLSDKVIDAIDSTRSIRMLRQPKLLSGTVSVDEHEILSRALGKWEEGHFPSIVLYKGIPIKGDCSIFEADNGIIGLNVENKQLIAAQIGAQWLIGSQKNSMLFGEVCRYDLNSNRIWLENLTITSEGFHLRNLIRYETEEGDHMIISIAGKKRSLSLLDVSEKGLSIQTDDTAALVAFSAKVGKRVKAILFLGGESIEIDAEWLSTVALDDSSMMKAAFAINYDVHNGNILRNWLNAQQLRLIKEVRNFVQMIPSQKKEPLSEWVI